MDLDGAPGGNPICFYPLEQKLQETFPMSAETIRSVVILSAQKCASARNEIHWPSLFSLRGTSDGAHSAPRNASGQRTIVRLGKTLVQMISLLVGVSLGLHVAIAALIGVKEVAGRTAIDPLGTLFASCVVTLGLVLTSICYGVLRNQLDPHGPLRRAIGFWYGFVYTIAMTLATAGLSKVFELTVGTEVRQALPTEIDFVFLALAMVFAAVFCAELCRWHPWKRMRSRVCHD